MSVPRIEWPAQLGSTNDELAARLAADPAAWQENSVLGTDFQSAGHGRLGRTWTVPPGASLTFSTPVRVPAGFPSDRLGWLPVATGWCVAEALAGSGPGGGVGAGVKWPNDVLVGGRKICGILTRACPDAAGMTVIIGIGVNVSLTADELPVPTATSLELLGASTDREELLVAILARVQPALAEVFGAGNSVHTTAVAAGVRQAMVTLGAEVRVELPGDREFTGRAVDLDEAANLVVQTSEGTRRVSAGDVIHARPA